MREKIAQRLCAAAGDNWDDGERVRLHWLSLTRIALAELETPDEGMVEAGASEVSSVTFADEYKTEATRSFTAMIQHARKDEE